MRLSKYWQRKLEAALTNRRLVSNVLKENVQRLQELNCDISSELLIHNFQKAGEHVSLKEETGKEQHVKNVSFLSSVYSLKDRTVILIAPNKDLCNRPQCLDQETPISIGHGLISRENLVELPKNERISFCEATTEEVIHFSTRIYIASSFEKGPKKCILFDPSLARS